MRDQTSEPVIRPDDGVKSFRSPDTASLLADVGQLFNSRLQINEIVGLVAKQAAERLCGDCVFALFDPATRRLVPTGWFSKDPARKAGLDRALGSLGRPIVLTPVVERAIVGESSFVPVVASFQGTLDPVWQQLEVNSLIAVPALNGTDMVGLFYVVRDASLAPFTAQDVLTLEALAPQAGRAIGNARLLAEERWQRQKAELMFQVSKAIHTELNFDQAVREIALLMKQAIRSPWVGLLEYQFSGPSLRLLGSSAEPGLDQRLAGRSWTVEEWPEAKAWLEFPQPDGALPLPAAFAGAIGLPGAVVRAFPLMHKLLPQGLLAVIPPPASASLPMESVEVATAIAELVALAIANQHLIEQEAQARIQVIRSQAAAQEREVLLRQIVHDLRNATQAMSLVVEDMELDVGDNPTLSANLVTINSQISFVSNFLKEKLAWIQQGQDHAAGQATPLTAVFQDLEARFGPAARAKSQRLVISSPEAIQVGLSAVQLEQIIGNLIDNALKYTPVGGEIRLRGDYSDGWVTIYVTDNGQGISPAIQARLGEVGYRGPTAEDGSGLGLANVRQLVTRAGGLFGFSSQINVGTTFHVSLPTTTWGRTGA